MAIQTNLKRILVDIRLFVSEFGVNRITKNAISCILLSDLLYTVIRYSSEIRAGGNAYLTGDWLINYEGGYNGRGLFGQAMLWISDSFHLNLLWTVYVVQISIYFIYFPLIIVMLRKIQSSFSWIIGLSPVFLMFDFLDTGGAFRKEILGFASLALIVRMLFFKSFQLSSLYFALFLFLIFLFSWDAAFCFIPMYLYLFSKLKTKGVITGVTFKTLFVTFILLGVSSISRGIYFSFSRSPSTSIQICDSLRVRGLSSEICNGTITSITEHSTDSLGMLRTLFLQYDFGFYIFPLMIALLPFFLSGWLRAHIKIVVILFASIFPMFLLGEDYGRWLHIFGTFVTLAWMVDSQNQAANFMSHFNRMIGRVGTPHFLLFSLFFTTMWRIPVLWGSPLDSLLGLNARILTWIAGA